MNIDKINNRIFTFWFLQIFGWTFLGSVYVLLYHSNNLSPKAILEQFITEFSGFLVTILLRYFYKKFNYQERAIFILAIIMIVSSFFIANLWLCVNTLFRIPLEGLNKIINEFNVRFYFSIVWGHFFLVMTWSALYFGIKLWKDWTIQKIWTEKAIGLAQNAQLQMLRYQLNPHFLFNSLNSIRALINENTRNAKTMITELAEFLRYSLISKTNSDVPLNNEIKAIRHYFAIEKIRYEEKLIVEFDIDPLAEDYPVLSFLIHPIIENAIKYGMKTSSMPLEIGIKAKVIKEILHIEIRNSGKWIKPSTNFNNSGTGTGLENVRQRLENAFSNKYKFNISEEDGNVIINLEIDNSLQDVKN